MGPDGACDTRLQGRGAQMISLTIGLALAVSIAIGRVRKINIGLVAIPFAYIIGAFFMHMKPSDVIDLWPTHIFFVILAIS